MKEFLEMIVKSLVDKPEEVKVSEVEGEGVIIYEIHVAEGEIGKVIGKHGKNVQSIRTLMSAVAAAKKHKRVKLEIVE